MSYLRSSIEHLVFECPKDSRWVPCAEGGRIPASRVTWPSFSTALNDPIAVQKDWQQQGMATAYLSQPELERLEQLYIFREHRDVSRFLERHSFLAPLLVEIYGKIQQYFPFSPLILEVFVDPETDTPPVLFVNIATNHGAREALSKLRQLNRDWWLENLDLARDRLYLDVELL